MGVYGNKKFEFRKEGHYMKKTIIFIMLAMPLLFSACSNMDNTKSIEGGSNSTIITSSLSSTESDNQSTVMSDNQSTSPAKVTVLTAEEAKARLDADKDIVILDVRTKEEYLEKHIPNALLLPVDTISEKAATVIPEKTKTYFIYCRSGNRSATAAAMLVQMGYTSIYDFGGIIDWPYETTSGE